MVRVILDFPKSKIEGFLSKEILYEIDEDLSYQREGYEYNDNGLGWSGEVHKFNRFKQTFPLGIYKKVLPILKRNKIKYKIIDNRPKYEVTEKQIMKAIEKYPKALRPYHIEGVLKGIKNANMTFWWCTGSGKTVLFSFLIKLFNMKTLILIHRNDILEQHIKNLKNDLNTKIGKVSQGRCKFRKVTVATVQSLMSSLRKKPKETKQFLEEIEYLVFDEAHHAEASTWKKISSLVKNAKVRHGFSGTPYSLSTSDLELECVTGVVGHRVTLSQLINWGYAAKPIVKMRHLYSESVDKHSYNAVYNAGIVKNSILNKRAIKDIMKCYDKKLQTLVIVRSVEHGHEIYRLLKKEGLSKHEFQYIHGGTPQDIRNEVKVQFEEKELRILVVSAIWNEGVDVPSANALIKLDGGGGSDVRDEKGIRTTVQQVGRVIRKEKVIHVDNVTSGPIDVDVKSIQYAYIYDYYFHNHRWLTRHSKNRLKTYKLEDAFKIKEIGK